MADTDPAPTPDPTTVPSPPVATTKTKPVVLATGDRLTRFVVPADLDDHGQPKGDPITVTDIGVALSKKQADHVEALAAQYGVRLVDITPNEKD